MQNGPTTTMTPALTIERYDPRADLNAWDDAIIALDGALTDAATARTAIDAETVTLGRLEAGAVLSVDGRNESEQKARLTLTLADAPRCERHRRALTAARHRLLDAERRVQVTRERGRLLRAALARAAQLQRRPRCRRLMPTVYRDTQNGG